jgi:hypothetical protein
MDIQSGKVAAVTDAIQHRKVGEVAPDKQNGLP